MSKHEITLNVNGEEYNLEVKSNKNLLRVIRENLGLTGTNCSCERGDCGTCTILIDGEPAKSCLVLAVESEGKEITTIEGLTEDGEINPIQEAFIEHGAVQCGFCTPAFILTAHALLEKNPDPTEEEVKEAIDGILCRCTGYRQIIDAILDASNKYPLE
ncbi:MAG: (2Fe-2S)-binding protein [Hadesarchaea archaeon]|nr:(2Fe-2S)-binding protein [Hadesarchaea archaeon]